MKNHIDIIEVYDTEQAICNVFLKLNECRRQTPPYFIMIWKMYTHTKEVLYHKQRCFVS